MRLFDNLGSVTVETLWRVGLLDALRRRRERGQSGVLSLRHRTKQG